MMPTRSSRSSRAHSQWDLKCTGQHNILVCRPSGSWNAGLFRISSLNFCQLFALEFVVYRSHSLDRVSNSRVLHMDTPSRWYGERPKAAVFPWRIQVRSSLMTIPERHPVIFPTLYSSVTMVCECMYFSEGFALV